jgi:hypothetical protein
MMSDVLGSRDRPLGIDWLAGPGPIMPSDIEHLVREIILLKEEVRKIRRALEQHGIKVD